MHSFIILALFYPCIHSLINHYSDALTQTALAMNQWSLHYKPQPPAAPSDTSLFSVFVGLQLTSSSLGFRDQAEYHRGHCGNVPLALEDSIILRDLV
jgi:hypothetical protein